MIWRLLVSLVLFGCASTGATAEDEELVVVEWRKEWVQETVAETRLEALCELGTVFPNDTPRELVSRLHLGDCTYIATYIAAVIKSAGYPHPVEILFVGPDESRHAILLIQYYDGTWGMFDTLIGYLKEA